MHRPELNQESNPFGPSNRVVVVNASGLATLSHLLAIRKRIRSTRFLTEQPLPKVDVRVPQALASIRLSAVSASGRMVSFRERQGSSKSAGRA